jgi:hypothetical protein
MKKRRNRKHFEATRDLWKWLAEIGADDKQEWPRYDEVAGLVYACAFCEYFGCLECPLGKELGICSSHGKNLYDIWCISPYSQRKVAARKIYEFTDGYIKETFKERTG